MRKEMDNWDFFREGESEHDFLARFFIAIDELRARLNPGTYPNLEISDEGYLWFNIPSSLGMLEIFALPYGLGPFPECALALSFPHDPEDMKVNLAGILSEIAKEFSDVHFIAAYASAKEIMKAYNAGRLPELHFLKEIENISTTGEKVYFFSYFGLWFSVRERDVLKAETLIREILSHIEKSVALQKGK